MVKHKGRLLASYRSIHPQPGSNMFIRLSESSSV